MANCEPYSSTSGSNSVMGAVILSLALHCVFAVLVILRLDFPVLRMKLDIKVPALQVNWVSLKTDIRVHAEMSGVRDRSSFEAIADLTKNQWKANKKIEENPSTILTHSEVTTSSDRIKLQDSSVFLAMLHQGTAVESLPGNMTGDRNQGTPVILQASASLPDPGESGGRLHALPRYRDNQLPIYPAIARRLGYEGTVVLSTEVCPDGHVGNVVIKRSSGFAVLDKSASETIRRWIFVPGFHAGRPETMWVDVPVTFRLTEKPVS